MVRQIVYISTARKPFDRSGLNQILIAARRNNGLNGVTGLLLFDGRRFLQALEGSTEALDRTLSSIHDDPRHFAMVVLKDRAVRQPEFGTWAMAAHAVDTGSDERGIEVDALVASVSDVNVRAQFSQFARRDRVAA